MAVLRTIQCDICKATEIEPQQNAGWIGWGSIHGVELNGTDNPSVCPECLAKIMDFVDGGLKNGMD